MTDRSSPLAVWSKLARPLGAVLTLAGVTHLVKADSLLSLASRSYDLLLDVEFEPRDGARNRVRLLGLFFIAAGAHLLYYGGVLPKRD
ncbi:hypothetical protein [Haloarchaeobius sp. HME9146]|uniref:hypothetical protein n=1 Tax=Haloarchaeobius sp. HME9146 TaxID=2978732 RepID=UPI0021BF3BF6|nr:hypothetical protein [Haloarchaeobius sp. HME9146]MCT9094999.1 hypothetical protein [Haloarchaeobius sp. HME9146]